MRAPLWIFGTLLAACTQTSSNQEISSPQRFNHPEVYKVIHRVIADQGLDKNLGIDLNPTEAQSLSQYFLNQMLLDTTQEASVIAIENGKLIIKDSAIFLMSRKKWLTQEDVDHMLTQKEKLKDFQWDNARLGFNSGNEREWYEFSVPLFSKDSTKIVMEYQWRCNQFLCGHDVPVLLTWENGIWILETGPVTNH
jgi:hypothetical protein